MVSRWLITKSRKKKLNYFPFFFLDITHFMGWINMLKLDLDNVAVTPCIDVIYRVMGSGS